MQAAITSRDKIRRAVSAKEALFTAIASGSLDQYEETLEWTKRFIRDPLTAKAVFSAEAINTTEGVALLSGIPDFSNSGPHPSISEIQAQIRRANGFILSALQTAEIAFKEPSFSAPAWSGYKDLVSVVVSMRLERSIRAQKYLGLSDDQIYDLVWNETLNLALDVEKRYLTPSLEGLFEYEKDGPISFQKVYDLPDKKPVVGKPWFRFIDNLAQKRDTLWIERRLLKTPAVTRLPEILPHGLPLESMFKDADIAKSDASGCTPFLFQRAKSVVFPDPKVALLPIPEDEELYDAVEKDFVNIYHVALSLYVNQSPNKMTSLERKQQAWDYAIEKLSEPRMSRNEALRTWETVFLYAGFSCNAPETDSIPTRHGLLPSVINATQAVKWSPDEDFIPLSIVEQRDLSPPAFLDYSTNVHGSRVLKQLTTEFKPPRYLAWVDMWSWSRKANKLDPSVREGKIVSALLYMERKVKKSSNLLANPFPSEHDMRYPPVYLSPEFLRRKDLFLKEALLLLRTNLLQTIPTSLLLRLSEAALVALAKDSEYLSEYVDVQDVAFNLLVALTQSDQPQVAINIVVKTILDNPAASSWHRQLLSKKFLLRLSAPHARQLIIEFADAIVDRLREQARRHRDQADDTAEVTESAGPYIKITTIKMLAQLLTDPLFVSQQFALDTLCLLLENCAHIDIKIAILESLFAMLANCSDANLAEQVLQALSTAIPIASGLSERDQLSEEEWKAAETDETPPEVMEEGSINAIPSVLGVILKQVSQGSSIPQHYRLEVLRRILLPSVQQSIENNRRWMYIFAAKYELDLALLDLPLLPVFPYILPEILHSVSWADLPLWVLSLYHRFFMLCHSPPRQLLDMLKPFTDTKGRKMPDIEHFLAHCGYWTESGHDFVRADATLPDALLNSKAPTEQLGHEITLPTVLNYTFEQLKAQIDGQSTLFDMYMRNFRHLEGRFDWDDKWIWVPDSDEKKTNSLGQGGPAIQRMITYVENQRTLDWQRNADRSPAYLPSMLKYKLWLLPYPPPLETDEVTDPKKIHVFVEALLQHIQTASGMKVYHANFAAIKEGASYVLPYYRADVACLLGALEEEGDDVSFEKLLCIDIALALFKKAEMPKDDGTVPRVKAVLKSWQKSMCEDVRMKGRELVEEWSSREPWKDLLSIGDDLVANL
jgi:hypothetical protein